MIERNKEEEKERETEPIKGKNKREARSRKIRKNQSVVEREEGTNEGG